MQRFVSEKINREEFIPTPIKSEPVKYEMITRPPTVIHNGDYYYG
jgi:hypothetical protein